MSLIIEAIYENGVLRPAEPLPLKEQEKVSVTINPAISLARRMAGIIGWKGDAATFDRLLAEAEEDEEFP